MSKVQCPTCKGEGNLIWGAIDTEVYDGVLYWICLHCTKAFPRDFGDFKNRQEGSNEAAAAYNRRVK